MINTVFIERILNINCIVYLLVRTKALCDGDLPPPAPGWRWKMDRGQGTAQPEPPLQSLPKIRLPSSFPGVLYRFDPKTTPPAWPWVSGMRLDQARGTSTEPVSPQQLLHKHQYCFFLVTWGSSFSMPALHGCFPVGISPSGLGAELWVWSNQ